MIPVTGVTFRYGTEEELLPQFHPSFPCISTLLEFPKGEEHHYPWHWHKAVEIFYVEKGWLVHETPLGEITFPAGSGAIINASILHSARAYASDAGHRTLHHLFDPILISGAAGGRIEENYVLPFITSNHIEIIPLMPDDPRHTEILELIRQSFQIRSDQPGYELRIRNALAEIWLNMLHLVDPQLRNPRNTSRSSEILKQMLQYVHTHHREKLTVSDIANAAHVSEYMCSNLFQKHLHTTPAEYLSDYRLRLAYQMLAQTDIPISEVSAGCGMNHSHFTRVFRQTTGYTPLEYRRFYHRQSIGNRNDT